MKKYIILCLTMISLSLNVNSQSAKSNNKSEKLKSGNSSSRPSEPKENTFKKGQLDLNLGIGFGRAGNYYYRGNGNGYNYSASPPLSVSVDYGITKNVSLGGFFAFTKTKLTINGNNWHSSKGYYDYTDTYSWSYFIVGARGAFHFAEYIPVENLDVYAGAMIGNNFAISNYTTTDPYYTHNSYSNSHAGVIWGVYAGTRYMFTDKIGAFGEIGYGLSYLTLGLNIKL